MSRVDRWQPIAKAPIDGTPVLIGWWEGDVWHERRAWWKAEFESGEWDEVLDDVTWRGAWTDDAVYSWAEEVHEYSPTHFRRLPAPPPRPGA